MTGDVEQGVAGISGHNLKLTDDIAAVGGQGESRAPAGDRPTQKQRKDGQTQNQTHHYGQSRGGWYWFHRQVMRGFKRWLGALLVATILGVPAVSWANGRQPWILVETGALTLTVFSAEDRVLARFHNISVGSGGVAEIHRRGDATTPQGVFHVAWIARHSPYETFYGLDYPSASIARRAHAEGIISRAELDAIIGALQQYRLPPQDTPLGGRLGIHGIGHGDPRIHEAFNWTDGCVALTNPQIRQLSRWVHVGTRVVIR